MVSVEELMHDPTVVGAGASAHEVAQIMDRKNIGSVLVEGRDGVTGIITERDIMRRIVAASQDPKLTTAAQIMTRIQFTISYGSDVLDASEIFRRNQIRRLPVVKDGRIVGILTTRDVAKAMPFALQSALRRIRGPDKAFGLPGA
jgi:CBS domain-containing protein